MPEEKLLAKVGNLYLQKTFNFYDDVLAAIDNALVIDYSKRIRTLGEIKKNLANTKKRVVTL